MSHSKITRKESDAMIRNALDNFGAEVKADSKRDRHARRTMRYASRFTVTVPSVPGQPADHYEGE